MALVSGFALWAASLLIPLGGGRGSILIAPEIFGQRPLQLLMAHGLRPIATLLLLALLIFTPMPPRLVAIAIGGVASAAILEGFSFLRLMVFGPLFHVVPLLGVSGCGLLLTGAWKTRDTLQSNTRFQPQSPGED